MRDWNTEIEERIRRFRPIDDVFFEILADDKEFCEEIRECTGRNSGIHIGI